MKLFSAGPRGRIRRAKAFLPGSGGAHPGTLDGRNAGCPRNADIVALRAFDDGQIVEIIAHVALNLFTNYVNIALDVPVDFPRVNFRRAA